MLSRLGLLLPLDDLAIAARFIRALPGFLQHPLGPEQARSMLRRRLDGRQSACLTLLRRALDDSRESPYRQLLALAGCEAGDLDRLVHLEGVEGTLQALFRAGVYLTLDEFKGRRPVVRGSATIAMVPGWLRNGRAAAQLPVQSGASRGSPTAAPFALNFVRACAANLGLVLSTRGGAGWRPAVWGVPGGTSLVQLLRFAVLGQSPIRWFSQLDPAMRDLHPAYRWSARALRWGGMLAGVALPEPRYGPIENPLPVARWMTETLRAEHTPHLWTFPSSAVRLCEFALRAGLDLAGSQITVGGEPFTPARLAAGRLVGACIVPYYATNECGLIGYACAEPATADDVHLFHDLHALIPTGPEGATIGLPARALLISSLSPSAPLSLLNVSMGDEAELASRACGCPLERLGWTTHLQTIRSYEKLTAGGMTFLDTDVIRVLEEVLPARFGGGPADYQLVEDEADGGPRVRLFVHPAVGPLDQIAVAEAFLTAIGAGSGAQHVMALQWRQAGFVGVERRVPLTTPVGKILHLHQDGRA